MAQGNAQIAGVAINGLTATGFERRPGYCCRWVRQCVEKVYGRKFSRYFKASAVATMAAFKSSPYAVPVENGSIVGDLLFKGTATSGKYGHCGIRIPGNRVAENSSAHTNEVDREARGVRTLEAFGRYELIVRLPPPATRCGAALCAVTLPMKSGNNAKRNRNNTTHTGRKAKAIPKPTGAKNATRPRGSKPGG